MKKPRPTLRPKCQNILTNFKRQKSINIFEKVCKAKQFQRNLQKIVE